jgi:hypothetical protein
MLPLIPYFVMFALLHQGLRKVVKHEPICILPLLVNFVFILVWSCSTKPSDITIDNCCALIISYYVYDIVYQDWTNQPNKWVYIKHHIVAIIVIYSHIIEVLPMQIGINYLTLFEFSNTFLLLFTFFHKQKWKTARNIAAFPFVFTYVPLRMIAIPMYSLHYIPYIRSQMILLQLVNYAMLTFLNAFSMFYGFYVAKKFMQSMTIKWYS